MSYYQETIHDIAARLGYIGANTRHIEAWIRVGHGTLDGLSREMFEEEVERVVFAFRLTEAERDAIQRPPDPAEPASSSWGRLSRPPAATRSGSMSWWHTPRLKGR